ncbi:hypothetical protein SO802_017369 [Lithocarpus litseifolius]|uniref:Uncharacterized protein n=1 Tax=Lithocarpus litseifolius TaxID=425828 RepID=A0AAW2CIY4_9ROSI
MSSFDTYGINGKEDELSFIAAGEGFASYSSFPSRGFPADVDVAVDHDSTSLEIYGFDDPNPGYSQSPFNPIHMDNGNGNENGYGHEMNSKLKLSGSHLLLRILSDVKAECQSDLLIEEKSSFMLNLQY